VTQVLWRCIANGAFDINRLEPKRRPELRWSSLSIDNGKLSQKLGKNKIQWSANPVPIDPHHLPRLAAIPSSLGHRVFPEILEDLDRLDPSPPESNIAPAGPLSSDILNITPQS